MGKLLIQIYEIQTPQEAENLSGLGVDHVGGVLPPEKAAGNPVLRETAAAARSLGAKFSLIPLFTGLDAVCRAVDFHEPDIVHFCDALAGPDGKIPPLDGLLEIQARVKERFPQVLSMRTIPVPVPCRGLALDGLSLAKAFEAVTDFFLLDTWMGGPEAEPVQGYIGITGRTCDWDMAARIVRASARPVILAGGISPENVFDAVARVRPAGVDSCTRTNAAGPDGAPLRFVKDRDRVLALVREARRAEDMLTTS